MTRRTLLAVFAGLAVAPLMPAAPRQPTRDLTYRGHRLVSVCPACHAQPCNPPIGCRVVDDVRNLTRDELPAVGGSVPLVTPQSRLERREVSGRARPGS